MARRLLIIVALGFTLLAAAERPTVGRAQQPPSLTITAVDASGYPQITAVVTALDANGVPVAGLTAESFRAFDGEAPLAVSGIQTQRLSLSVAVVIDVSGSMQGAPMASAKEAAKEFVQNLSPEDSASIFAFSTAVRQATPFTTDTAQLVAAIDELQAAGDTSLFEAAQTAVFAANLTPSPRKAVVLMTDGENVSPSQVTADGSLSVARDARIPVYSIGFGPGPDTTFLQAIAQTTNGQYRAADVGTVSAVYGDISRVLNSVYTLTLTAPSGGVAAGASTLRVVTEIGSVPAEGTAPFERPGAVAPTPDDSAPAAAVVDEEPSDTPLVVYGGIVGVIALGLLAVGGATVFQRTRTRQRQLAVVAPNLEQAVAQPLPQVPGAIVVEGEHGAGRLIALDGDADGVAYDFTSTPLLIGSGHECQVRVARAPEVAPKHASLWMRDGKIMLRHTGGPRRPTLVAGRPVEWLILDHGDEFAVGTQRYRVEVR